jgi:hypothetical protein
MERPRRRIKDSRNFFKYGREDCSTHHNRTSSRRVTTTLLRLLMMLKTVFAACYDGRRAFLLAFRHDGGKRMEEKREQLLV